MSQPLDQMIEIPGAWCGRSWEGLADRRYDALQQALKLQKATAGNLTRIVSDFLAFFDDSGIGLFRDEEEWIFRSLRPTPQAVLDALAGHIEISSLIQALLRSAQAGCVDIRVVHRLGESLETHLLLEEAEVRPLLRESRALLPAK